MTSLKLFYRRGVPAALLLGLIVGAPGIAQAVNGAPPIPARGSSLVPFGQQGIQPRSSSLGYRSAGPSSVTNQTVQLPTRIPSALPSSQAAAAAAAARAAAKSGVGGASRIVSPLEDEEETGDNPL